MRRRGEKSYGVNLKKWTCGCRKWDMRGVPCNHDVCAIYKSKQQPEDFVHEFFKKPMYLEAYKPMIYTPFLDLTYGQEQTLET